MFLTKEKKSPYYQIVYFVDGKRRKKSTKKIYKSDALKLLKKFEQNFNGNVPVKQIIYLSEFQKRYLKYSEQSKTRSYIKSISLSLSQLLGYCTDIPINNISTRMVDEFINSTYSRSKSAAGLYYRTLKAAFSKALVWEYIQENPFKKIKAPRQVKSFPIFINKEELQLIIDNTKHEFLKDIFITGFYTGMRLGELLNMNWSWIDFNHNLITIKNSTGFTTKSKKERIIPIHQKVKEVLAKRYSTNSKSSLVFYRYEGIKLNGDFVSKQFKKTVRIAGLNEHIHMHSLRHAFCSNLVSKGVNIYTVKELAGHQSVVTTQIYSHLEKNGLQTAISIL